MKTVVALVTGGYSGESVISYLSAKTIEANIDREQFDVYTIDITPAAWTYTTAEGISVSIDKSDFTLTLNDQKIKFDTVLMGIHGTPGEDGKLQGYFDLLNIPYTSCDAATSALTFNKSYTVAVAAKAGIHVADSVHLFKGDPINFDYLGEKLRLPVFVKPNNGGSSIGMSKVNNPADLPQAIEKAFKEDDQVLIESFIAGPEYTVGVFKVKGDIVVLPITEVIAHNAFFDFEAKYTPGMSEEVTPAKIDAPLKAIIEANARKIYEVFNCRGIVRIDFIYNMTEQQPYLLEINTVPGQSAVSLVPQQLAVAGIGLKAFYSMLLHESLA